MVAPKVSIVVPAYNVEAYIENCLNSLLAQTLEDIEIIVVDDGSLDKSGEIAEAYARRDSRVTVIHQKNMGLGPARNTGMRAAKGQYVGFVDSDDWVAPQMYQDLYSEAREEDADIAVGGLCSISDGKIIAKRVHPLGGTTVSGAEGIMQTRNKLYGHAIDDKEVAAFPMSACIGIYRRSLLEEHGLAFINIMSEDTVFNLSAYKCAKTITFLKSTDYFYRKENQNSITQTFSEKKILRFQEFLNELLAMARSEDSEDCVLRAKRTSIEYCRLYVGIVARSKMPMRDKISAVRAYAEKKEIRACWDGYPTGRLPIQQRIFHLMIVWRCYGAALLLTDLRQAIRDVRSGRP